MVMTQEVARRAQLKTVAEAYFAGMGKKDMSNVPWADDVAAIMQCWFPGEELGNALADVLSGDASPSGKLPTTLPVRIYAEASYSLEPTVYAISTLIIATTIVAMLALGRLVRLDRVFAR